jgi:hypothetical protein
MKTIRLFVAGITMIVAAFAQRVPQCDPGWKLKPDGGCERETKAQDAIRASTNTDAKVVDTESAEHAYAAAELASAQKILDLTKQQYQDLMNKTDAALKRHDLTEAQIARGYWDSYRGRRNQAQEVVNKRKLQLEHVDECVGIYGATVDKKMSDLTVRETEQVKACKSLDVYPPTKEKAR